MKIDNKDKIIVALDVETAVEAREIIAELRGEVGAFKIGLQLFTAAGASFFLMLCTAGTVRHSKQFLFSDLLPYLVSLLLPY